MNIVLYVLAVIGVIAMLALAFGVGALYGIKHAVGAAFERAIENGMTKEEARRVLDLMSRK